MGERRRVLRVARERAVGLAPDVGRVIQPAERFPTIAIVWLQREDLEDRFAHHSLTLVTPQAVSNHDLPVQGLRLLRRQPGGGAELLERLVAADRGPEKPDP